VHYFFVFQDPGLSSFWFDRFIYSITKKQPETPSQVYLKLETEEYRRSLRNSRSCMPALELCNHIENSNLQYKQIHFYLDIYHI